MIGATFEAIALRWDGAAQSDPPSDPPSDPTVDASGLRERLEALSAAGVHVVLVSEGPPEETQRRLQARPGGPGTLHLCAERGSTLLAVTGDGSAPVPGGGGALGRLATFFEDRGVTGGLTLVLERGRAPGDATVGDRPPPLTDVFPRAAVVDTGVAVDDAGQVLSVLDEQLTRRAERRVPQIDQDPAWTVPLPEGRDHERMAEALATLSNGCAGTRGSRGEVGPDAAPLFLVNGVYGADDHLLPGPLWTGFDPTDPGLPGPGQRMLDLRGGTLYRFGDDAGALRSLRFVSLASPEAMALRAEGPASLLPTGDPLRSPSPSAACTFERRGDHYGARTGDHGSGIAVAARERVVTSGDHRIVERLATWSADRTGAARLDDAYGRLVAVEARGFDRSLADHRHAWARRWADADVTIDGDPAAELAARFAVFQLLSAAAAHGESAVGARGLTGTGYAGHVFWDADVFVLPALVAIHPAAARSMLEYRIRRLPTARAAALALGRSGARFPWESAGDGSDVTPREVTGPDGEPVAISTGPDEEHIVADVAWAAAHYADWTGDADFLAGPGRPLLVDTARYWASRVESDADGRGHIRGVVGPDEYHVHVDDNAFTNVMARWNLRRGAAFLQGTPPRSCTNSSTATSPTSRY